MNRILLTFVCLILILGESGGQVQKPGGLPKVTWDKYSLMIDGRRVCPVMGEVHYSRIPQKE